MRLWRKISIRVKRGAFWRWLVLGAARALSSPVLVGLWVALYGLGTHYVSAMRQYSPLRIAAWFDVKSQVGNVFYAAIKNAGELPGHLFAGKFVETVQNLTNLAGIRSTIYTRLIHADATNNAEWFVGMAPFWILGLLLIRGATWLAPQVPVRRALAIELPRETYLSQSEKIKRKGTAAAPQSLRLRIRRELKRAEIVVDRLSVYVAKASLAAAVFGSMLLNTAAYYQDVAGLTGILAFMGSGLATTLDVIAVAGSGVFKELIWHASFVITDGREKTIGLVLQDRNVEFVSHYLARFPAKKIPEALHTAVYQALAAGCFWAMAHTLQQRRAQRLAARHEALPPHMKRYLAKRK